VYATGSCGRGEMGPQSDLDVYVVRSGPEAPGQTLVQQASEIVNRTEDDTREEGGFTKRMRRNRSGVGLNFQRPAPTLAA